MIGQRLLGRFNSCPKTAKAVDRDDPFFGLNILFARDFMQLSPAQDPALYMPNKVARIASVFDNSIASSQQENVLADRSRHRYKRDTERALVVGQARRAADETDR
jgi:hypothetical protein